MQSADEGNIDENTSSEKETEGMSVPPETFQQPAEGASGHPQPREAASGHPQPREAASGLPPFEEVATCFAPPPIAPWFWRLAEVQPPDQPPAQNEPYSAQASGELPVTSPRWKNGILNAPGCSSWSDSSPHLHGGPSAGTSLTHAGTREYEYERPQIQSPREVQTNQMRNPQLSSLLQDTRSDQSSEAFDNMVRESRLPDTPAKEQVHQSLWKQLLKIEVEKRMKIYYMIRRSIEESLADAEPVIKSDLAVKIHYILLELGIGFEKAQEDDLNWDEFIEYVFELQKVLHAAKGRDTP